jgi:Na+/H+ antiporter NhaD/arsenite permease-like protein
MDVYVVGHDGPYQHRYLGKGRGDLMELTRTVGGYACLAIFLVAYVFIVLEEPLRLRKSIPALIAAGAVWIVVAILFARRGEAHAAGEAFRHNLLDYAELMLFLLSAMTFVNTLEERQVFAALRAKLAGRGFTLRGIFWITGALAFLISPIADNLTTALIMGAVALAVGRHRPKFVVVACINVVVAANAGGAFSPFGDITTLMAWQRGVLPFTGFFSLLVPSLVNWLVPAFIMSLSISKERPQATADAVVVRRGGFGIVVLLLVTIALTVAMHSVLHLPPVFGMMTGLGLLKVYGYGLGVRLRRYGGSMAPADDVFDVFRQMERVEWDTLMFFYGIILTVGALGALGYLALASGAVYGGLGPTVANVLVGVVSALVDNIPIMFAVLNMHPAMSEGQWLLVTLTAGVGGSLLSVGSAAGVALMGQARGVYTFREHLRWTWAIALGYVASIATHLLINGRYF